MDDDHGQLLAGRYRLGRLLGQGGMGAVWRAHDEQLERDVAVKELRLPEHLGEAQRQNGIARLDREARAAARLKHPGIITVHDRVTGPDGRPWIVMELVEGGSLADLVEAQGPLTPQRAGEVGRQVAAALGAAHRMGITHRDIKPANILLEGDRVVLTDFGIAALEGDATLTATGMIMGTPAFMAPEQVRGLPATAESDLWSLGATLYAAVEGRAPFAGTAPSAVLVAVATEPPIPAVRAGALGPVLDGLLHKDPAGRLTMAQLQARLTRVAEPAPGTAVPAEVRPPTMPAWSPAVPQGAAAPVAGRSAASPGPVPRRRFSRRAKLGASALVLALAADSAYTFLRQAGEDSTYEANRRVAEALTAPAGFSRHTTTRIDGNQAQVTYTWPDPCVDHCADQVSLVEEWMKRQAGTARVDALGAESGGCLAEEHGCPVLIDRVPSYKAPALRGAALRTEGDRLSFRVDVGR
ncbi:serine/threonine-protein kinase [Streptomyces sp. NPDC056519]|uniref:serine/threonine-protein kinase n=1 Tax=Streptomyces sp. NPDC056519 TaxID=3345849 RepID=UPI0036B151A4